MSTIRKVQDGGGDSLPMAKAGKTMKPDHNTDSTVRNPNPYEGSQLQTNDKVTKLEEEKTCVCSQRDVKTEQPQYRHAQKPIKNVPHRRHEDQRHMLQFDYSQEVARSKKKHPTDNLSPVLIDRLSDEEMESSPLIEDKTKEIQLERQREYRKELGEQIAQREQKRLQQKAKKSLRTAQKSQETAAAATVAAAVARGSRSAAESYENQLRKEQMMDMRRQLQLQREREVQRLRRIYRKDDRKFLAHLQRLKLQDVDSGGHGESDFATNTQSEAAAPKTKHVSPSNANGSKTLEAQSDATQPMLEVTNPESELSQTEASKAAASPRNERHVGKKSEKKENSESLRAQQPSSKSTNRAAEKPAEKPLTYKQAYLRLQQQRRAEEKTSEERRAKMAMRRAESTRQERLEREARNMAEWRAVHSLAGVPLVPIAPTQKNKFDAAASWLEKQRALQQEKRVERDRQLMSWKEEKNRQINERRMKEKAEQKVAKEMQVERRKEAEKCYERWLHEIRARKAVERASVPRGAIGVSTYSSTYSVPSPWRQPSKQVWRGKSFVSASLSGKGNDVTN